MPRSDSGVGLGSLSWRLPIVFASVLVGMFLSFGFFSPNTNEGALVYPVWPASGINMGLLWLLGVVCWPAIAIGSFVGNLIQYQGHDTMWRFALLAPIGDTLEAVLGVVLLRRVAKILSPLRTVAGVSKFVALSAVVATACGAIIGIGLLEVDHAYHAPVMFRHAFPWFVSTSIAVLVITPMMILWNDRWRRHWGRRDIVHAVVIALLLGALQGMLFLRNGNGARVPYEPLVLLSLPLVFWAGSRFGMLGSAATVLFTATTAIIGTNLGYGPFQEYPWNQRLTVLQLYLGVIALVGLYIGAVSCEREDARVSLERQSAFDRLLYEELNHRVRNTLASLLAIIDLGKTQSSSVEEYARLVTGRIHAMARVHDILTDLRWKPISFRSLLSAVSADIPKADLHISGDRVNLVPAQALAMGMILHELLTNASRHGALSQAGGSIDVLLSYDEDARRLELDWIENAPSGVSDHWTPGDGMRLIDGLVRSDLRGQATLCVRPEGAHHRILVLVEKAAEEPAPTPV